MALLYFVLKEFKVYLKNRKNVNHKTCIIDFSNMYTAKTFAIDKHLYGKAHEIRPEILQFFAWWSTLFPYLNQT